jgi:hypothetical protein
VSVFNPNGLHQGVRDYRAHEPKARYETAHFFNLARAAVATRGGTRARRSSQPTIPDGMQALMDSMLDAPAIVMTGGLDVLAANPLGRALYAPVFDRATGTPNLARFVFFDPTAEQLFPEWEKTADEAVGLLQAEAARSPNSPAITQIVGELATRSDEFRTRWAAHNVTAHRHGAKRFRHRTVGELTLTYNVFTVAAAPALSLVGYTAEPNSPSAQAIQILGSWVATERRDANLGSAEHEGHPGPQNKQLIGCRKLRWRRYPYDSHRSWANYRGSASRAQVFSLVENGRPRQPFSK